jgi:spoIIIJ-associated protein
MTQNSTPSFSPVRMRASSEESAVSQALMLVGATRDQVLVEVLDQDAKGVTVRVSPRAEEAPVKEEAPTRPTPSTSSAAEAEVETVEEEPATPEADDDADLLPVEQADEDMEGSAPASVTELAFEDAPAIESESSVEEASVVEATHQAHSEAVEALRPQLSDEEYERARSRAMAGAQEMLDRMGMEAQAQLAPGPFSPIEAGDPDAQSRVYVSIEGEDVGILIGKHGATLQAFQYLLNLALNNHGASMASGEEAIRVVVDAGGYRSRRADVLQRSAVEAAARSKRDRRSIRLEPMPAHERRLVHMALRDDAEIATTSEGREPQRHIIITPANARPGERPFNDRPFGNRGFGGRGGGRGGGRRNDRY